jgi:hypothetical protein
LQVKGLIADGGGRVLDHLSVICPWVLTSVGGRKRPQKVFIGTAAVDLGSADEHRGGPRADVLSGGC